MNPWFVHLTKVRRAHPKLSLKEAMKLAKKSYKKVGVSKKHHVSKKTKKHKKSHKSRKSRKLRKSRKSRKSRKH